MRSFHHCLSLRISSPFRHTGNMNHFEVQQGPLHVQAMGTTRAGLIVAALKGFFAAAEVSYPLEGEDVMRPFQIEAESAPQLILAVLRAAAGEASAHQETFADISFSLITDKKATGSFVGRATPAFQKLPAIRGIDGDVVKDADGVWRATVGLG